jgi:hypothetical protein
VSAGTVVAGIVAGALVGSMTAARVAVAGAAVGRKPQAASTMAAKSRSLIGWVGFISMPFLVALNQSNTWATQASMGACFWPARSYYNGVRTQ